jgi:hypothetical protein
VNHVGSLLCRYRHRFFRAGMGLYQSGGAPLGEEDGVSDRWNHGISAVRLSDGRFASAGAVLNAGF